MLLVLLTQKTISFFRQQLHRIGRASQSSKIIIPLSRWIISYYQCGRFSFYRESIIFTSLIMPSKFTAISSPRYCTNALHGLGSYRKDVFSFPSNDILLPELVSSCERLGFRRNNLIRCLNVYGNRDTYINVYNPIL